MEDYVNLKSVHTHLKAGVTAVHVVFDNPGSLPETPNTGDDRIRSHESPLLIIVFSPPMSRLLRSFL